MHFLAHIRKGSHVDRMWRDRQRLGGLVGNVQFTLIEGIYRSTGYLSPDQVADLQLIPVVVVEALMTPAADLPPPVATIEPVKRGPGRPRKPRTDEESAA